MSTRMPTRLRTATDPHPAPATPRLESAPHNLELHCSRPTHTPSAPPNQPALVTVVRFRAIQPHHLSANSIQSPYIHRPNGLTANRRIHTAPHTQHRSTRSSGSGALSIRH
jgi:hypothetical protein